MNTDLTSVAIELDALKYRLIELSVSAGLETLADLQNMLPPTWVH